MRAAVGDGEVYVLGASGNRVAAPLRRFQVGDGNFCLLYGQVGQQVTGFTWFGGG